MFSTFTNKEVPDDFGMEKTARLLLSVGALPYDHGCLPSYNDAGHYALQCRMSKD